MAEVPAALICELSPLVLLFIRQFDTRTVAALPAMYIAAPVFSA
jgi:hypothetical protein